MISRLPLLLSLLTLTSANIYTYTDTALPPDVIEFRRVGMWAPEPKLRAHKKSKDAGDSSVTMELKFTRPHGLRAGLVQVAFFHADQLPRIGAPVKGHHDQRAYCCTSAAAARHIPGCAEPGRLIVAPAAAGEMLMLHDVSFGANASEARLSQRVRIRSSGMHYLLLSSCDAKTGIVRFSGQTIWRNPHGHLPGELYFFLPFFGLLTLGYLLMLAVWGVLCCRYWSQLLPLQAAIAGVIFLAVLEAATWWRCYHAFNESGNRGLLPTVLGVFISTIRKTVSRGLVLAVCLGYGVVRPTLGSVWPRILLLGSIYFVASGALDVVSNVSRLEEFSLPMRLLFVLPVGLLDALSFWWCCSAISRTLSQLSARRQVHTHTAHSKPPTPPSLTFVLCLFVVRTVGKGRTVPALLARPPPPHCRLRYVGHLPTPRHTLRRPRHAVGNALDV